MKLQYVKHGSHESQMSARWVLLLLLAAQPGCMLITGHTYKKFVHPTIDFLQTVEACSVVTHGTKFTAHVGVSSKAGYLWKFVLHETSKPGLSLSRVSAFHFPRGNIPCIAPTKLGGPTNWGSIGTLVKRFSDQGRFIGETPYVDDDVGKVAVLRVSGWPSVKLTWPQGTFPVGVPGRDDYMKLGELWIHSRGGTAAFVLVAPFTAIADILMSPVELFIVLGAGGAAGH